MNRWPQLTLTHMGSSSGMYPAIEITLHRDHIAKLTAPVTAVPGSRMITGMRADQRGRNAPMADR
jgi:hypothetical protein